MKIKNLKKLFCSLVLFLLIVTASLNSFAATEKEKTTFELVDESVCTITLEDMAKFEKKLTDFDAEKRFANLTLTLTNLKSVEQTELPVELFLVIDNSTSMIQNSVDANTTRKQAVINSANILVDKLFEANSNAKVGIVSFSSLDSVAGETEGTINDAELVLALNSDKANVKAAIDSVAESKTGPRTNIEAGLEIASQNYTTEENTKRYIVLLTDGVPNNALDGSFGTYIGNVGARTKAKLEEIEDSGIDIIGAMIGLDSQKVETQSNKTYLALAEEVFGTVSNPTISSYYYVQDSEIETTIVDKIYNEIVTVVENSLKNITVKDYFPQEIIDNFTFEYIASPNIGNVSTKIDTSDNSITWTIEVLKETEVASLSYKLTLKDNFDKKIIDKILPTNEKVELTATHNGTTLEETSNESPKVRIKSDDTTAPTVIPQTGDNSHIFVTVIAVISVTQVIRLIYLRKNSNI